LTLDRKGGRPRVAAAIGGAAGLAIACGVDVVVMAGLGVFGRAPSPPWGGGGPDRGGGPPAGGGGCRPRRGVGARRRGGAARRSRRTRRHGRRSPIKSASGCSGRRRPEYSRRTRMPADRSRSVRAGSRSGV